ncbi:MAG TPA: restriction endonuclease [Thermoanaerobaculia bacterium]
MNRIELTEYAPRTFTRSQLSDEQGEAIYRLWGSKLDVEFPSPKTMNAWRITPHGWVGLLPVTRDLALDIRPKVPIANILRMFEYAYGLRSVEFHKEVAGCATLDGFYSKLAQILSTRILHRARRGLYRGYIPAAESLPAVRGRIDVRRHVSAPCTTSIPCDFEEHTTDVIENQILAWTLTRIAHSTSLAGSARPLVRNALRTVRNAATERTFRAADCVDRLYNRLNDDYQQLHLLCRFFLEHTGPTVSDGEAHTVPFVVNMARLFELFVAEWLRAYFRTHAPRYTIRWQDHASLGVHEHLRFSIDIVVHDRELDRNVAVVDAKYKVPDRVSTDDVAQVTLYAQLRDCRNAVLVYPAMPKRVLDATTPQQHRIRTLWFALEGDLDEAGRRFASEL